MDGAGAVDAPDPSRRWPGPPRGGPGRRRPPAVVHWLTATACWGVTPLAWLGVVTAAGDPEHVGFALTVFALTTYGWIFLVPLLVVGGVLHLVLALKKS